MKPIAYVNVKTLFNAIFKYFNFSIYKNIISPLNNEISISAEKHNFNFNTMLNSFLQNCIYYVNLVHLYWTVVLPLQIAICHLYMVTNIYPVTIISIQATSSAHIVSAILLGY